MTLENWIRRTVTSELQAIRGWYADGLFRQRVTGLVRERLAPIYLAILEELGERGALEAVT